MRIAQVISSLDPGGGGLPKSAAAISAALAERGEESALIFFSSPSDLERIQEACGSFPGFEKVRLYPLSPGGLSIMAPGDVRQALNDFSPGIIHTHGLWEPILAWAQVYARKHHIPYVVSPHSMLHPWHCSHHRWAKWGLKHLLGWRYRWRQAAFVHVLNEEEGTDWLKEGVVRIRRIPNGIFSGEDAATSEDAFPEVSHNPFILSLARLHPQKAPDLLIRAFSRLKSTRPDLHLVLAGPDYGLERDLKALAHSSGCGDSIHFPGELKGSRKWNALHQCSCFCLPSRAEGFSMALLEAALAGAPVVLSENCCFNELVQAGGALQTALNPENLAETLDRALSEGASMGTAARELVLAEYTWEKGVGKLMEAYREFV